VLSQRIKLPVYFLKFYFCEALIAFKDTPILLSGIGFPHHILIVKLYKFR